MNLLLLTLTASPSFGATRSLTPAQICGLAVSGDRRLDLIGNDRENPRVLAAQSRLMNEAWWPVMKAWHATILSSSEEQVRDLARAWNARVSFEIEPVGDSRRSNLERKGYAFDGEYKELLRVKRRPKAWGRHEFLDSTLAFPFGDLNRAFLRRAYLTSLLLFDVNERNPQLQDHLPGDNRNVVERHSFTRTETYRGFYFAIRTMAQAFALVTAGPLPGLTAEQVARRASRPKCGTSAIERLALGYPPSVWGLFGDYFFVKGAVRPDGEGRVELTPEMYEFMTHARATWARGRAFARFETNLGCPVAYPSPERGSRTGVGLALEAFWHIYDRL